jgi:hypothetical protein
MSAAVSSSMLSLALSPLSERAISNTASSSSMPAIKRLYNVLNQLDAHTLFNHLIASSMESNASDQS